MPPSSPPALPSRALYLIDTMGYIFRAFHALPPLTNSRGEPTAAVLGFTNMLRKLVHDARPEALAAVYDVAGPTFRDEAFTAYKANRAEMPEALARQLPQIRRALEVHRVPVLEHTGFEADDLIGTIARRAAEAGHEVVIVSSDKDLMQLVADGVRLYNPTRNVLYDAAGVEAALGVRPSQVADYLALLGDTVDNIPGAPGIGEKGAQQLIQKFGSVENAVAHAAEVERKTYRESLLQNAEQIRMSKMLATIRTDVPIECAFAAWALREPDVEACRGFFTEMEFHALLRALPAAETAEAQAPLFAPSAPAADATALQRYLEAHRGQPLAMALDDAGAAGLHAGDGEALLAPPELLPALAAALEDARQPWRCFDAKRWWQQLRRHGLPLPPLEAARIEDVNLLGWLHDPNQNCDSTAALTRRLSGQEVAFADPGAEAAAISRLAARLRPEVEASGQWPVYRDLDLPLLPVLDAMETVGVRLDPAQLQILSRELGERCEAARARVFELAGFEFNLNSPKQLSEALFDRMGLPRPPRAARTGTVSTAADVLEGLAAEYEIARQMLEYRQWNKLKNTYADTLPAMIDAASGRVHTTFTVAGSATGRLASNRPNLQNIPIRSEIGREIRAAFQASPGYRLISADYSQIELRLLAHFSQDPLLLEAFRRGDDIHARTAAEVFGVAPEAVTSEHRRRAKAVNFGIVYGLSAFGLAQQLGIPQAEAALFIRRYFERYAGVQRYIQETLALARSEGRVRTLFGRVRPIPNLDQRNPALRGFAERTAINTPLQGTAADLIKLAMIRLHPELAAAGGRLLLQVHDELVLEAAADRAEAVAGLARRAMEEVAQLTVPLRVEVGIGDNWRDL